MVAFRRYTNLSDLIHILREKTIFLRDPTKWDDKNDSYFLEKYKEYKGLKTLLSLCFADNKEETYHHWRVFSSGADGVSIRFNRDQILDAFRKRCEADGGVRPFDGCVKYVTVGELEREPPCIDDLPFRKWLPYRDEYEYRLIYSNHRSCGSWGFDIELNWVEHISLSPWLPEIRAKSVIDQLRSICDCSSLRISRSRVIDFDAWKAVADRTRNGALEGRSAKVDFFDPIQLAGAWPGDEPLETLLAKLD